MKPLAASLVLAISLVSAPAAFSQAEYELDLSKILREIETKPYSASGFLEFTPALVGLDTGSAIYQARRAGRGVGSAMDRYTSRLRLEGSYRRGLLRLYAMGDGYLRNDDLGWTGRMALFQGYVSLRLRPNVTVDIGKRGARWGKGYAWNPAAFIDRPKDLEDPQEALEGFTMLSADLTKSFSGPLKTLSFTPAVLPVSKDLNAALGPGRHVNVAGKLYALVWDTDVDFMFLAGPGRHPGYGFDFSRNIRANSEVHGEWARRASVEGPAVVSGLVGFRYLTADETTLIAEYYRNGDGLDRDESRDLYASLSGGASGETASEKLLARQNLMQDYLYLRASKKEPFEILYLTPEIASIINLADHSFSVLPGLSYSPTSNLQLRLRAAYLAGAAYTEYGEKQSNYRIEVRVRFFFQKS